MKNIYTVSNRIGGTPGDGETFVFHTKVEAIKRFNELVELNINFMPSKAYEYDEHNDDAEENATTVKELVADGCIDIDDLTNMYFTPESSLSYDWDGGWWGNIALDTHPIPPVHQRFCSWGIEDVEHKLKELKEDGEFKNIEWTEELGMDVMSYVDDKMDANYGTDWTLIEDGLRTIINEL